MRTGSRDITKAVILARGLGKRMRSPAATTAEVATLAPEQSRAADAGMKAMIPVGAGRPFLDFVLSGLADAGFGEICLVIGPEHGAVREYYRSIPLRRIRVSFAIQDQPIGTANAMLAVESFAGGESFLVMNSDNYYPVEALAALRSLAEPGLPAFERETLVRDGNIPAERVRSYALLKIDAQGYLAEIVEKPNEIDAGAPSGATAIGPPSEEQFISMNCWRFDWAIFRACREVPRSKRGEFELPEAVQYGMKTLGLRFKTFPVHASVLDLSYRGDIAEVARRLAGVRVEL
jgi:dTDP-glucose pyrophosphorylase